MPKTVGYLTGTFDIVHPGHIHFLKTCRSMMSDDGHLIVGLTTDTLARTQKRPTLMNFEQRREILINFPFVDSVIAHSGQSKVEMHDMLHYHVLFTGEEYYGTDEYTVMKDKGICTVYYIPCPLSRRFSSSAIARQHAIEKAAKVSIIKSGTAGLVYRFNEQPSPLILKTVRVSQREYAGPRTANVYSLPVPYPRNMKRKGEVHVHPNLPGVNGYREIDAQPLIRHFSWCPTISVTKAFADKHDTVVANVPAQPNTYSHVVADKAMAREIYFVHQFACGEDLHSWILHHERDDNFLLTLHDIIRQVQDIARDLLSVNLVHGDIHSENLCIAPLEVDGCRPVIPEQYRDGNLVLLKVSLIDFGWCMHRSFVLDSDERTLYESQLQDGWDYKHFVDSMEYMYEKCSWYADVKRMLL